MKNNQDEDKRDELISGLSIRRAWIERVLTVFSLLVIAYTIPEVQHEIAKGKDPMTTANAIFTNVSVFMTVAFGCLVIVTHGIDQIMFRYIAYKEKLDRVRAEGKAEGKVEGKTEGKVEGKVEGKTEVYQEVAAWNARRMEAEARGEKFTEPPPSPPQAPSE